MDALRDTPSQLLAISHVINTYDTPFTMTSLNQAFHLGSLLLPHNALQEHAAHPAEWSTSASPSRCRLPTHRL